MCHNGQLLPLGKSKDSYSVLPVGGSVASCFSAWMMLDQSHGTENVLRVSEQVARQTVLGVTQNGAAIYFFFRL